MRVWQVVTTVGKPCGIAYFSTNLEQYLTEMKISVTTSGLDTKTNQFDLILVHYHPDLFKNEDIRLLRQNHSCPIVLFAHDQFDSSLINHVDAFIAMTKILLTETMKPNYHFSHPSWVPNHLEKRNKLRHEFGWPANCFILGSNGFLKFEREYDKILSHLLPYTDDLDFYIQLILSPWRIDSPGLMQKLLELQDVHADRLKISSQYLNPQQLNRRLQACDLLWCWTKAPSQFYASGVISDQYASGTRIVASAKHQHNHITCLPNVVSASDQFDKFINELIDNIRRRSTVRHKPNIISWEAQCQNLPKFLSELAHKA